MHIPHDAEVFVAVAEDCPATTGEVPPQRARRSAAQVHYEMAVQQPYRFTQPEILFAAELTKKGLEPDEHPVGGATWRRFYSKGQPCLRASALGKRYGWGLHMDAQGKVAGFAVDSATYGQLEQDARLRQTRAMASRRRKKA